MFVHVHLITLKKGNASTLASRGRRKNRTAYPTTARPHERRSHHENLLPLTRWPYLFVSTLCCSQFSIPLAPCSLSCKPWRGAPPVMGTGGPAHPRAPPVAAKPSAGCAGRRHTHPLLQRIRRGCGGGFRVDLTAAAVPGQLRLEEPSSGTDLTTPRVDLAAPDTSGSARQWLAPEWWGEGGESAGLSVAALCPLPPRGVAGSLLASPVDAPLPVMGGSLLFALFIWDLIFFDVAITVYRCCNWFLRMLHRAYRCCLNVLWMLEYTRF
jgi:hypothetical protein